MQEDSTTTNASGFEFGRSGAALDVDRSLSPTESTARTAADPIVAAGSEEPAMDAAAEALPKTSSMPAPAAVLSKSIAGQAQGCAAKSVLKVKCIKEVVRTGEAKIVSYKPPFEVEEGCEGSLKEIIRRAEFVCTPWAATPVPSGLAPYGTSGELFLRLQTAIAAQTFLPPQTCSLLTYWTISTWFSDGLPIAPGLTVVGPPHEGNLVLRALRNFCRFPLMMTGISIRDLKNVNWSIPPTLLCYEPNLTKQMASLLGCTTTRGYMVGDAGSYKDFFGAKCVYLGEQVSVDRTPRCSIQVNVNPNPTAASRTQNASPLNESAIQDMQNQLLRYRLRNLVKVYHSDFDACSLTSDTRAIANALGACVIDSPELQSQLVSLLTPVESQRQTDRATCLEAVTLEATLNLAHAGKTQIMVGEIAKEVNRIVEARGELLRYSAETIGHRLKKIGLVTRRLGKSGNGLLMDLATMTRVHELANAYGVGLDPDEKSLQCPVCTEKKTYVGDVGCE